MRLKKTITTGAIVAILSGAAAPSYAYENLLGTLAGAAGGAVLGSNVGKGKGRIAAIAVGTLVGAGIGNAVTSGGNGHGHGHRDNRRWDNGPRRSYHSYSSYSYGTAPSYWANPGYETQVIQVNNSYPSYQVQNTGYCREFNQGITIGGKVQPGYGTACLQPDGSWEIQK